MDVLKRVSLNRRKVLKAGALAVGALAVGISPSRLAKAAAPADKSKSSPKMGFMFNQQLCIGCRSCEYACKKANNWDEGVQWRRVLRDGNKRIFLSISCNHCEKPACLTVCPAKAYTIREKDGIVVHDPAKCVGCKYCLYACPYHTPQYSSKAGRVSKCSFCYELQDEGKQPACVASCPAKALTYGEISELRQTPGAVSELKGLPSADLTKPSWVIIPKE